MSAHTGQTVGRSAELAQFDALLDGLSSGAGACVALEGEPGIGKSRLLAELRGRASDRGHVVLSGAAAEFERDLPYGVWVEALDAFVAAQQLDDERLVADLALALPSLRADTTAGDGRHRVHRAVRRLLGELAEREPVVLVLDDLHWGDPASIDLLSSIARRGMPGGVLLALGYRTGRAPRGLVATLAAASAPVIEVTALSQSECRALAGDLDPAHHTAIFRESGGNPFYALALAGAARTPAHSVSSDRLATDSGVPRPVAAALLEEFDALTPDARRLLDASAVAGDPFEPELAFAIAELTPPTGMTALDELLAVRLLQATAVPRRFAFRHPLVRRAVYESAGGGWRMTAHGRAAAALAERGAAAVTRAHHVEQSAVAGDPAAIALLLEAATASAPRAPAAAARWYAAALRLQPEVVTASGAAVAGDDARAGMAAAGDDARAGEAAAGDEERAGVTGDAHTGAAAGGEAHAGAAAAGDDERLVAGGDARTGAMAAGGDARTGAMAAGGDARGGEAVAERLRTLVALAHVLRSTGDLEACATRLGEALALVPDDDVSTRVRLIAARAAAQHFLGRHEQANRQLDAALDALGDRDSHAALTVLFARIAGAFFSLDVAEGCALGEEALAIAERLGDPLLIGASAAALAHAQANAGNAPAAIAATDLAAARLDAADDLALTAHIEALNRLAWAEHLIERDADAARHAQRGIAIARATGQDQFVPMLTGAQALSLLRQGQVASALALQVDALETAKVAANDYVTCWVLSTTAHIAIARGNGDDALRDAELAVTLVDGRAGRVPAMAQARLAVIRRALGERPQGLEQLLDALAPSWAAPYAEAVVRAELADGRTDAAEPFVERVEAAAAQLQLPWAAALADRARAAWRLARGDATEAVALALASIDGTQHSPITTARTQVLAGRALAQDGRRPEAIEILRRAERTFDAIGIPQDRDLARRELRKLHARAEPRGPSAPGENGLAALSTREREVAELVTARHTNREIAALLFLGEKTIETHLRNIFVKLGVSSRVDVARAVERGT